MVIFGVDNTSASHTDNRKNVFLVLGEGLTDGINDITATIIITDLFIVDNLR